MLLSLLAASAFAVGQADAKIRFETFDYAGSADGIKPLKADIAFAPDGKKKPLLVVMHGYSGDRRAVTPDLKALATRGVVAIAPDMRGAGGSAGKQDSGGLEVHDIADAVLAAIAKYPDAIDARNLNVVGYSGGGGNAIACMVRFPDLFRTYTSFFGISDYGWWHDSKGRPDCNVRMIAALGGPPEKLPDVYLARNAIPAAGNASQGKLRFFWDEQEKDCPVGMIEDFLAVHAKAGHENAVTHVSKVGDRLRWKHGYRGSVPDLYQADDIYLADILTPDAKSSRLPAKGTLVVPGYVVTRQFQVWVEDGQKGQVTVEYDASGETPLVRVVRNTGNWKVRIETKSPFASLP